MRGRGVRVVSVQINQKQWFMRGKRAFLCKEDGNGGALSGVLFLDIASYFAYNSLAWLALEFDLFFGFQIDKFSTKSQI